MAGETRDRRLRRWVEAGLISDEQAGAIDAFEDERSRPALVRSITALAGLAIGIGLLSIVAANWDAIPGRVKIAVDLLLVSISAWAVVRLGLRHRYERAESGAAPRWPFETAVVVLDLLVLASIALIGQVYQLGGEAHVALLTWTALTALLMAQARSSAAAMVWIAGLHTTWASGAIWLADTDIGSDADFPEALALGSLGWAAIATIVASRSEWVRSRRPALARVCARVGWAEVAFGATMGTFAFYERTADDLGAGWWLAAAVAAGLSAWVWRGLGTSRSPSTARTVLAASWAAAYVPAAISPGELEVVGALVFIALWGITARHAHAIGDARLLNSATALIGIRIVTIYFEVFGSLLDTGLGLVGGGVVTLGLVWAWGRAKARFETELEELQVSRSEVDP